MGACNRHGFASAILVAGIAGLLSAACAFAAAVVENQQGDVRVGSTQADSRPVAAGERVAPGSLVSTAAGSRVILRFDDGQAAALHENTRLRIEEFRYRAQEPAADRSVLALLRGALRIVTGSLGRRSPGALELRTSHAVIGVRGTDFMVALANPAYLSVLRGTVVATNAAGSAAFAAGELGAVADRRTLPAALQASALPGAVASTFGSLGALHMSPAASPAAADKVMLPEQAVPRALDPAAFGRDTSGRARELKDGLERDLGKETTGAARERGQAPGTPSEKRRP